MLLLGAGSSAPPPPSFTGVADQETTINHFWGTVAPGRSYLGFEAVSLCNNASTCGSAGVGTCLNIKTLSPSGQLDVSTGDYCDSGTETVTTWCSTNCVAGGSARVTSLCDQLTGSSSTCPFPATSASYAVSPGFILSGVNSAPTISCISANSTSLTASGWSNLAAGLSVGTTFERTGSFSTFYQWGSDGGTTSGNSGYGYFLSGGNAPNTIAGYFNGSGTATATALDGTGTTDFAAAHIHRELMSVPAAASSTFTLYVDGAVGGTSTGSSPGAYGEQSICGTTFAGGSYADVFLTNEWVDSTVVGSTVAEAVTNKTTVPLP